MSKSLPIAEHLRPKQNMATVWQVAQAMAKKLALNRISCVLTVCLFPVCNTVLDTVSS